MSEQSDAAEKSFEPTPKRLEQAREQGEVPKSNDLTAACTFAALAGCLLVLGYDGLSRLALPLSQMIANSDGLTLVDGHSGPVFWSEFVRSAGPVLLLVFAAPAVAAVAGLWAQQAIVFAPKKLQPKLSRLSPIQGAKNKFGANGFFEFLKSTVKLIVVSVAATWFTLANLDSFITSLSTDARNLSLQIGQIIVNFLLLALLVNLVIGAVDYFWQVAQHRKKNMMSRKEVEEEAKEAEGDPHLKQSRRSRAMELASQYMLSDVPTADVVIVNPTHFAVALKWDREGGTAPVCVAKGVDEIAARIREIAGEADVPIYSDPPTARALFAMVDIGHTIHPEHYKAVAAAIRFAEKIRKMARS